MIYFIKSADGSRIKIGTTISMTDRVRQLALDHGEGLEVLAVIGGSYKAENALHRRFAHLRRGGEWFEPGEDLLDFIAAEGKPWDGPARNLAMIRVEAAIASKKLSQNPKPRRFVV